MSRTRRIYNSKKWKKNAIRHFDAKYRNWDYGVRDFTISAEEVLEQGYVLYAGAYSYHKYKRLCMGCCSFCAEKRPRQRRARRRLLRKMEKNWEEY